MKIAVCQSPVTAEIAGNGSAIRELIAGPDGAWVAQCASGESIALAEIERDDPAFNIVLKKARPWRQAARQGDIYRVGSEPTR
jgi:predicted amidohydrolase